MINKNKQNNSIIIFYLSLEMKVCEGDQADQGIVNENDQYCKK